MKIIRGWKYIPADAIEDGVCLHLVRRATLIEHDEINRIYREHKQCRCGKHRIIMEVSFDRKEG